MTLPFSADAFFDLFAAYNARLWPAALLLWVGSAWAFLMLLRGHTNRSRFPAVLLVLQWMWTAVAYHWLFFTRINPTTWAFGILTIGFLLAVRPALPRLIAVVPILWAAIGGSAAILFGVWADLMMPVAAGALLVDVWLRTKGRHLLEDAA
jgi:hypothetical protein